MSRRLFSLLASEHHLHTDMEGDRLPALGFNFLDDFSQATLLAFPQANQWPGELPPENDQPLNMVHLFFDLPLQSAPFAATGFAVCDSASVFIITKHHANHADPSISAEFPARTPGFIDGP
jgi:hypothetical protein